MELMKHFGKRNNTIFIQKNRLYLQRFYIYLQI